MKKLLLTITILSLASAVNAEDWPGWLGPRRDGGSTEKVAAWKGDLPIHWRHPLGEGHSSPVVADGKVFTHTKVKDKTIETIDAFDAVTGKPVWSKSYDRGPFTSFYGNGPRGTPFVVAGKLYAFGITGHLLCLDAATGDIVWQVDTLKQYGAKNLFFGASGSPLVDGDAVFVNVGGKGASIVAFDKNTGKELWKTLDDKASYSSPIVFELHSQKQLVFLTAAHLVAVDPKDGKELWKFSFADALFESSTTPVRVGDILIGSSITIGSVGLKLESVAKVRKDWLVEDLTCYFSTPVAVGQELYLVTGTKPAIGMKKTTANLHCIDPTTGKSHWKRENVGKYHSSLLRTGDDKLLLLEEAGDLVLVDPDRSGYRELARSKICGNTWAHAALSNGRLFVRDNRELICVGMGK